jgi:hypothetical protein
MNNSKQTDFMAMNVTWSLEDLELYDDRIGVGESTIFTISKTILFAIGIIAQTTFYKMMKRLPGRVINQILYQHMVRATLCCVSLGRCCLVRVTRVFIRISIYPCCPINVE